MSSTTKMILIGLGAFLLGAYADKVPVVSTVAGYLPGRK